MITSNLILKYTVVFAVIFMISGCYAGQNSGEDLDPSVQQMLSEVSVDTIESNIRELAGFHTRHTTSDTVSDTTGIGAARRWIYDTFQRYSEASDGRLQVGYDRYVESENGRIDEPVEIVNIVAILPGTQIESKDRVYVVSGHYDSRVSDIMNDTSYAPGANDDASGTAAVLELARIMSQYEFDATIVFMAVAGEEQGLLGARHYAKCSGKKCLNIAGMFTNDIIGNSLKDDGTVHDDEVRIFAAGIPPERELSDYHRTLLFTGGENDTPARQLGRHIYEVAKRYMPDFKVNMIYRRDRYLRGGDHSAFLDKGFAAVRFSEPHEYYERQHQDVRVEDGIQYGDLPEFVDYEYVGKVTQLNAASLSTLANAPASPRKVAVEVQKLENNTTLRWKSNKEPDLKGYEIVWRATNQPHWGFSEFVGDTTRFTIEGVSKDNYLFGVRSVDRYGNRSPATYPLPAR